MATLTHTPSTTPAGGRDRTAGLLIGYGRVSTIDQHPEMQIDELTAAGCARVFTDHASGSLDRRPELDRALDHARPGDTVVVWRLDRLGRDLRHLIDTVRSLEERGIGFRSLRESIDTTTPGGRLVFHLFASLAEFERELIRERTEAGRVAARARGRFGGRPRTLSDEQIKLAREMYDSRDHTVAQIADALRVSRATIYRSLTATNGRPADTADRALGEQ